MSLTAYASLKTPHSGVFRAFGAPGPLRDELFLGFPSGAYRRTSE